MSPSTEWQNFWESVKTIVPLYAAYAIGAAVVSFCKYLERHCGKEPFSLSKLLAGLMCAVVYGLTLVFAALWLTKGNHLCAMFVMFEGVYRGRKWMDTIIDSVIDRYFKGGIKHGN